MAIKDLVADFGGVGDGQRQTINATIAASSAIFTPTSASPFGSGDVGKAILIRATNFAMTPTSAPTTITAYNSGTGAITLSITNSASGSFSANGNTQTAVDFDVVWGADNTNALVGATGSYRAWAQSLGSAQANLTIPAGRFLHNCDPFRPLNKGVQNSLITGPSGAPDTCILNLLNTSEMRLGGDVPLTQNLGLTNAAGYMARLNSTTAGSSKATLVDKTGYGSRITIGAVCFITGYDTQSVGGGTFGYPPNPYFYEVNKVIDYDGTTGTITFQNPLKYAYMSDWPVWSSSSTVTDQGGAATIYILTDYDRVVEIQDLTLDHFSQIACLGRSVILRNVRHPNFAVYPTQNQTFAAYSTTFGANYETDKIDGTCYYEDCTFGTVQVQSSSPDLLTFVRGSMDHLTGTPKNLVMDGVTMTGSGAANKQIQIGNGAGYTTSCNIQNCTNVDKLNLGTVQMNGIHNGGASATFTMTNGVISWPRSANDGASGQPNLGCNLVPGSYISLDNKKIIKITRCWDDGTNVNYQTTETGGWPFTVTSIYAHPCVDFTMRNNTGAAPELEDWNNAPVRLPFYSYSRRTYTAGPSGSTSARPVVTVWGRPTSIKATVTSLYTGGSLNFLVSQNGNNKYIKETDYATQLSNFGATINCKSGLNTARTMSNNSAPSNSLSGDTLFDFSATGSVWFNIKGNSGPAFSTNIVNGETPTVVVEYIMDQGIPPINPTAVVPLRFRLRA